MSVNSESKTEMQMLANACKVGCGRKEFGFLLVQWWISHLGHKLFPSLQQLQCFGTQAHLKTCNATRAVKLEENAPEKLYS